MLAALFLKIAYFINYAWGVGRLDLLKLALQAVLSFPVCVLGTESRLFWELIN